jgi:hypothetical protein
MKYLILFLLAPFICKAQIQSFKINGWNVEYYLPTGSTATKLPAVIFFPGNGEVGTDKSKLYVHGPMRFVQNGTLRPNYIIVACQLPETFSNETIIQTFLDTLIVKYKVDRNCFHLTGISGGAYSIFNYIRKAGNNFRSPQSIVPMGYSWVTGLNDIRYNLINQWILCGWYDSFYGNAVIWHNDINALYNKSRLTTYKLPVGSSTQAQSGHCCWNDYYNPSYREAGKNIYEWAMNNCNRALSLPYDSIRLITRQFLPDMEDQGNYLKFNQSGIVTIYRIDGARLIVLMVIKGSTIKKQSVTDKAMFIRK